jgi:hypothetical protein
VAEITIENKKVVDFAIFHANLETPATIKFKIDDDVLTFKFKVTKNADPRIPAGLSSYVFKKTGDDLWDIVIPEFNERLTSFSSIPYYLFAKSDTKNLYCSFDVRRITITATSYRATVILYAENLTDEQ